MIKNTQRTIANICIILTIVFIISGFVANANFKEWQGIAGLIILVSATGFFTSFICVFIFSKRANLVNEAINNSKYIAKWTYKEENWKEFVTKEYEGRKKDKEGIFIITTTLIVLIFGAFILFGEEGKLVMTLVAAGIIALLFVVAFVAPWFLYTYRKANTGEVVIMKKGVLINNRLHSWDFPMSKLGKVKHNKKDNILELDYEFWTQLGPQVYVIRLLIPESERGNIQEVIAQLEK